MKRKFFAIALAALTVGLLGSCSKINERLDSLEKEVGSIKNDKIAYVQQQIDGINTSINDLKNADATINGRIDELKSTAEAQQTLIDALKEADKALGQKDEELEERIATLEGQVGTINSQIEALTEADKAINVRIDTLSNYVDNELGKAKSWVDETFATLEQYYKTAGDLATLSVTVSGISTTLATVQTSITNLNTKIDGIDAALQAKIAAAKTELEGKIGSLKTELEGEIADAISASETSVKAWVNDQLEGYYTAELVDAKLGVLKSSIDSVGNSNKTRVDSLATELTAMKTAVDTAKSAIRTEYKAAIESAINNYDGEISGALKDSILAVNGKIDALAGRVSALETSVAELTGRIAAIEAMIQTVTIVPAYSDGSVEAKGGILTVNCVVEPAAAVAGIKRDSVKVLVATVNQTKASSLYETVVPAEISKTPATGELTVKADIFAFTPATGKALMVALKLTNGISKYTTDFVGVTEKALPDGALKGAFSVASDKRVYFSKGNLWTDGDKALHFEANQYAFNSNYDAYHVSLFTWSDNIASAAGTSNSGNNLFCDESHKVSVDGGDAIYYALSKDEWTYLFNTRTVNGSTGEGKSYQRATINSDVTSVYGMILYPDNYTAQTAESSYTSTEWAAMEAAGCVFLPAAGQRDNSEVSVDNNGFFWSSSVHDQFQAYYVTFTSSEFSPNSCESRSYGHSIRLVTDAAPAAPVAVTGVTLNKTTLDLAISANATLTATVAPVNATNKNVTWSSSAETVATVDQTGKVTAVAAGTATITAKSVSDNTKTATCTVTVTDIPSPLSGVFSVSSGKKVQFSQGNLIAAIDASGVPTAWRFATNQYDYIGNATANTSIGTTAGDVDLFGWSTDATNNNWGIHTKEDSTTDYTDGDFNDWGTIYCTSNGISNTTTWRTLTEGEWTHLFNTRTVNGETGEGHSYQRATINSDATSVYGIILYPDDYSGTVKTSYSSAEWMSLEAAGCVFLPAAGQRSNSSVTTTGAFGLYWSSSVVSTNSLLAKTVNFTNNQSTNVDPSCSDYHYKGCSVRLVTEVED